MPDPTSETCNPQSEICNPQSPNPLERSFFTRNLTLYYFAFWMAIAVIQFALSFGLYNQEIFVAVIDSLVSNIVFALLGVGLWYMVRFSGKQINGLLKSLTYQITVCAFTIIFWQLLSFSILRTLFDGNSVYVNFLFSLFAGKPF